MDENNLGKENKNREEKAGEWSIGFIVAFVVAVVYRFSITILDPFFDFIQKISVSLEEVLGFGLPGLISLTIFYFYSRNVSKSIVIGFASILFFIIVFILTLKELPGLP
jgi:hypothetical protein